MCASKLARPQRGRYGHPAGPAGAAAAPQSRRHAARRRQLQRKVRWVCAWGCWCALPAGTTLRFYAQAGEAVFEVSGKEVLGTIARNLQAGDTGDAARTYWSPDFGGAETTLELELPANADLAQLDIAVPSLSHFMFRRTVRRNRA